MALRARVCSAHSANAPAAHGAWCRCATDGDATSGPLRFAHRPALDGLRGLAALIVLVSHCVMTDQRWGELYVRLRSPNGLLEWLLVASPLRLLWAGDAPVAVFFVLSGYVLARPVLIGSNGPWIAYYVGGACASTCRCETPGYTALIVLVVPRVHSSYFWIGLMDQPARVDDFTLADPSTFLAPLWSLK